MPRKSGRSSSNKRTSKSKSAAKRSRSTAKRRTPVRTAASRGKSATNSAKRTKRAKSAKRAKVGGSREAARTFGTSNDFGVSPGNPELVRLVSEEVKHRPAGSHRHDDRQPRAGSSGTREAGVGGPDAGAGANSGGDVDPEF